MTDRDDVSIEAEDADEPRQENDAEKKVETLRAELVACREEKREALDGWHRARADYVNLLKRLETERKSERLAGVLDAALALLPAFDAIERAKEHLPAASLSGRQGRQAAEVEGFLAIARQLERAFASLGLAPLGEVGEPFDPKRHDAVGQDPAKSAEQDNTVSAVLEKGWRIGDIVVRPAKVRVAHLEA